MRKLISFVVLAATAGVLLSVASCGRNQELVSITVQPSTQTFGASNIPVNFDAGLTAQLQAVGTYIHPPVTKDITDQVVWASNSTQMVTVNNTGLMTVVGDECGTALVTATFTTNNSAGGISSSGAAVFGYMNANVTCYSGGGTGTGPALTVTFGGTGAGTVTSTANGTASGWSCSSPSPCVDSFPAGTVLTLTAAPTSPSTFGSWQGCDTDPSANPCQITVEANTTLTVTFN